MNNTLLIIVITILLLFLLFPLLFFLRRRVDLDLEGDTLVIKYPLKDKRIDLKKELKSWEVQQAYYIRWGVFYSINMEFTNGKRLAVNSLFNQNNFDLLFAHLNSRFKGRRKA